MTAYTFCNSTYSSKLRAWHIRRVTDTSSLCGRVRNGYDIPTPVGLPFPAGVCKSCAASYFRETEEA